MEMGGGVEVEVAGTRTEGEESVGVRVGAFGRVR